MNEYQVAIGVKTSGINLDGKSMGVRAVFSYSFIRIVFIDSFPVAGIDRQAGILT